MSRVNVLVAAGSFLFCFVVLEGFLRLFTPQGFALIHPSFYRDNWFEYHPELHYTLRRDHSLTVPVRRADGRVDDIAIRTNRLGTRGALPAGDPTRPLIVFVGDSFTEAQHVEESSSFAALTQTVSGGRFRTANFGVHSYNCVNYYKMALFAKREFAPSMIFVGLFIGNDLRMYDRRSYKPLRGPNLISRLISSSYFGAWIKVMRERLDEPAGRPGMAPSGAASAADLHTDFFDDFADVQCPPDTLEHYRKAYARARPGSKDVILYSIPWHMFTVVKGTAMVLQDLKEDLGDTRMHVLIIPERIQVRDEEWEWLQARYPNHYRDRTMILEKLVAELGRRDIAFTNVLPHLDTQSYLRFNGHLSARGHRQIADIVADIVAGG